MVPPSETLRGDARRHRKVRNAKTFRIGIAFHNERVVLCAQAPAELTRRNVLKTVAVRRGRDHVRHELERPSDKKEFADIGITFSRGTE